MKVHTDCLGGLLLILELYMRYLLLSVHWAPSDSYSLRENKELKTAYLQPHSLPTNLSAKDCFALLYSVLLYTSCQYSLNVYYDIKPSYRSSSLGYTVLDLSLLLLQIPSPPHSSGRSHIWDYLGSTNWSCWILKTKAKTPQYWVYSGGDWVWGKYAKG